MFRIIRDENNNNLHFFYEKYDENTRGLFRELTQVYYSSLEPVSEIPVFEKEKEASILTKEELDRFFKKGVPLAYHSSAAEPPELGLVFTSSSDYLDGVSQASISDSFYFECVTISKDGKLNGNSSSFQIKNVAPYNFNDVVWQELISSSTHVVSVKNRTITPRRNFDMSLIKNSFEYIPIQVDTEGLTKLKSFEGEIHKYHLEPMSPEELLCQLFQSNREQVLDAFSETILPTEDTDESAISLLYPDGYYLKYSNVFQVITLKDGGKVIYAPTRDYSDSFFRPRYVLASEGFKFTTEGSTALTYVLYKMSKTKENPLVLKSDGGYEIVYRQTDTQYTIYSYTEDLFFKERKRMLLEDLEKEVGNWNFIPMEDKNNILLRTLVSRGDSYFNRLALVKNEEIIIVGDYLYERPSDGRLALYSIDVNSLGDDRLEKEFSIDFQDIRDYLENGYELKRVRPFSGLMNVFSAFTKLTAII